MADVKISELDAADALTGTELVEIVQDGENVQSTTGDIAALASGIQYWNYAVHDGDTGNSAAHQLAAVFADEEFIFVKFYGSLNDNKSGGYLQVKEVRGGAYGGTVGTITNGGNDGLIIEGLWHRFAIVPVLGKIDIKRAGIALVEGTTGQHSRLNTILAYFKNRVDVEPDGHGVFSCTETVYLDRVPWRNMAIRFQGGTHAPNGATVGAPTFFPESEDSNNAAVTVTAGTPINVAHTAHGFSANQQVLLGVAPGGKIAGNLSVLTTYFVIVVDADNYNLATSSGGAAINNATAGIAGQVYAYYSTTGLALPSRSNVTTQDLVTWEGKVVRLGIVVRAASNGSNKDFIKQEITCWGDGNSDFTTRPSTMCIRHESDDSANGSYFYSTNYTAVGVGVSGPAEKHSLDVRAIYNRLSILVVQGGSADTLHIYLHNQDCQAHYWEHDGLDTSVTLDLRIESRDDPADDAGSWGADSPAIWVRNGKFTKIMGDMRGGNGLRTIVLWGTLNNPGTVARKAADSVLLDVHLVQGSGIALDARAITYLAGRFTVRSWDDATGTLAQNCPAVQIGRVMHAGNFFVDGFGINNYRGVQVGEADAGGFYPKQVNLGHYAIDMGTVTYQFAANGTENSGSSAHPTTLEAIHVEKWDDCVMDISGTRGNVTLDAGCEGGVLQVDPLMKLFTIDDRSSPATTIGYPTLSTSGLTIT